MKTTILPANTMITADSSNQAQLNLMTLSNTEMRSAQEPLIARRAFLAAMCSVFAQEFRAGRHQPRKAGTA